MSAAVRWNVLHPGDPNTALIVPREDLRALEAERDLWRAEAWPIGAPDPTTRKQP